VTVVAATVKAGAKTDMAVNAAESGRVACGQALCACAHSSAASRWFLLAWTPRLSKVGAERRQRLARRLIASCFGAARRYKINIRTRKERKVTFRTAPLPRTVAWLRPL